MTPPHSSGTVGVHAASTRPTCSDSTTGPQLRVSEYSPNASHFLLASP